MRKVLGFVFLVALLAFGGLVGWWYVIKPRVDGVAKFERTESTPVTVTIPLGGQEFVDIEIDGINQSLLETNYLTVWQFDDCRVMRTSSPVDGKLYSDDVYYSSSNQVYKKFGDYYVTVTSKNKLVDVSVESMKTAETYTEYIPSMDETNEIMALPEVSLPSDYVEEKSWKLPVDVEGLVLSSSGDDMSYYKGDWYFNYNFRYMKYLDAMKDAAVRVTGLTHEPIEWWYDDGSVFVVKAGAQYACVKKKDYTSCYFISSNDLAYIMLNLE